MAKDPYRYFRVEARELLDTLSLGLLGLEKGAVTDEATGKLLRHAHTLKGAARIVKQLAVAEHAHALEEALAALKGHTEAPPDVIERALRLVDRIDGCVTLLEASPRRPTPETGPPPESAPTPSPGDDRASVRVDVEDVDVVLAALASATVQMAAMRKQLASLEQAGRLTESLVEHLRPRRAPLDAAVSATTTARLRSMVETLHTTFGRAQRALGLSVEQTERELLQAHERVGLLRLTRAVSILPSLERAVRDAGKTLGRSADLEMVGGEARLDSHVLTAIRDALLHVVRNAVAHGVEPSQERLAAGKPERGRIRIEIVRRGARVAFICRDDGRGVDVVAIRRVAVDRGLIAPAAAESLDLDAAVALLLRGGVTTTQEATAVSGRGVGLDVVRETAALLKGEVRVTSGRGVGTTVELIVPVTLSAMSALIVEAGGERSAIPLSSVAAVARLEPTDIARSNDGDRIFHDGRAIPLVPLETILRRPQRGNRHAPPAAAAIVRSGDLHAAVGVDRLLGSSHIVTRPLPALAVASPVVAGALLDAEGTPQLLLDPDALVSTVRNHRKTTSAPPPAPTKPLLVVDDSLTTRILEQSILESAGYEVDLAVSAEEALEMAAKRAYGMFVVDVEMPGMNGFELIEHTQKHPGLSHIPSILVTSRDSPEDRARGERCGAKGYVVKGDFDQDVLLGMIRELVG